MHLCLKFVCNDQEFYLGKKDQVYYPADIEVINGIEASEYEVLYTNYAVGDGAYLNGKRILPRPIHIEGSVRSAGDSELIRSQMRRFFNPKYTGMLYIDRNGIQRKIEYEVEGLTFGDGHLYSNHEFILDIICLSPMWMDVDDFGRNMAEITPLFTFPWMPLRANTAVKDHPRRGYAGQVMGYRTLRKWVYLKNDGDVSTGIRIVFRARGNVVNPKITLRSTGQFVRIITEMQKGDRIEIDTTNRNQTIKMNGENIYNRIDRQSQTFEIKPGGDYLEYDADENYTALDVDLFYTPLYLGV